MFNHPLPRIDKDKVLGNLLLPYSRFAEGTIWSDKNGKHKIACVDVRNKDQIKNIFGKTQVNLSIQDPPYNFIAFTEQRNDEFISWCQDWIALNIELSKKIPHFIFG